ncbi:MAG: sulfotransferase [Patescibacteria group bacterium]
MNNAQDKIIIITGMHRSGTSLLANYLQKSGLNIGNTLMDSRSDNKRGFFEDTDFTELHQKLLDNKRIPLFTPKRPTFSPQDISQLKKLVNKKNKKNTSNTWGWKDPRTVLFLRPYKKICPNANYIFIFRHPFLVIDSLIRRWSDWPIRLWPFNAARSWLIYNKKILDFYEQNKDHCLLISLEKLIEKPDKLITQANQKYGISLEPPKFEKIFDPKLLKRKKKLNILSQAVIYFFKAELLKLYQQLKEKEI